MGKINVLGVGSALVDVLARVDDAFLVHAGGEKGGMEMVPRRRQDELIARLPEKLSRAPGGAAGNTIFALANFGVPVAMLSKVGEDAEGVFYRRKLEELGGRAEFFTDANAGTGRCLSLVTPDSERTMRSELGASQLLTAEEVAAFDFSPYTHVYVEGYMLFLPGVVQTALRRAKAAGCRIGMDLASFEVVKFFRGEVEALLREYVDLVFANEDEAAALLSDSLAEEAAARKLGEFCEVAALKLGPRGSLICRNGRLTRIAIEPVEALDTTAAGDSWAAGFLYGELCGLDDAEAGRIGSLVSAEVVQVMGSELPPERWQEIRQKLQRKN